MKLIDKEEILKGRNALVKGIAKPIFNFLQIDELNRVYEEVEHLEGNNVTIQYLKNQKIKTIFNNTHISDIPKTGSVIFICNHPTGALDGVVLISLLSQIRPDIKFMGNFLLSRMIPLRPFFIDVNPFDSTSSKNLNGIRSAINHLQNGGAMMLFPAGEVSSFHNGFQITDREWPISVIKLIQRSNAPVVPLFLSGKNSLPFHLLGLIHPRLRTLMLARELVNKYDSTVRVEMGSPIYPTKTQNLTLKQLSNLLRTNVYILQHKSHNTKKETTEYKQDPIAENNASQLEAEVELLKPQFTLFEQGNFSVLFAATQKLNYVMKEIGRLREITFREIGEGTNLATDIDKYDAHYHQLFIWDNAAKKIVGAYRLGIGEEILKVQGVKGFYTHSLFKMKSQIHNVLSSSIELGRSFIVKEYQKKASSLVTLWKGIMHVLLKYDKCRYLIGPVSISNDFSETSKLLIAEYLQKRNSNSQFSKFVVPINGFKGKKIKNIAKYIDSIPSIDLLDKLVSDLEDDLNGIPILIKKYTQLNGKVLAFNLDPDFNNTLDGLLLLDLQEVPENAIEMLSKTLDTDTRDRFKNRF